MREVITILEPDFFLLVGTSQHFFFLFFCFILLPVGFRREFLYCPLKEKDNTEQAVKKQLRSVFGSEAELESRRWPSERQRTPQTS